MERLHKVLAHAGVASRRKAEELILARRVRVNGQLVTELGTQVDPERDRVEVDGRPVRAERKIYLALNKPRGYLSDRDEGQDRPTALDLVPSRERLYAAGRLDLNSEGLLLLTNDGDLAHRITHPRFEHEKEYLALVEGTPGADALAGMQKGVRYEGGLLRADAVQIISDPGELARRYKLPPPARNESWLRVILHEGKKREVRHLGAALGHPVKRLVRVRIGPVQLGALPPGEWRGLQEQEIRELSQAKLRKTTIDSIDHRHRRARRVG